MRRIIGFNLISSLTQIWYSNVISQLLTGLKLRCEPHLTNFPFPYHQAGLVIPIDSMNMINNDAILSFRYYIYIRFRNREQQTPCLTINQVVEHHDGIFRSVIVCGGRFLPF
jgi:hypothetical protein